MSEAPVVGVIGGGQLARMMQPAAIALGVRLRLLAESPSDCATAAIPDAVIGTHHDLDVLREFAKGRLVLRMEDSSSVARWMGAQELLNGSILTVDEVLSIVDGVTAADLKRVARDIFVSEQLSLAVVGPMSADTDLTGLLQV